MSHDVILNIKFYFSCFQKKKRKHQNNGNEYPFFYYIHWLAYQRQLFNVRARFFLGFFWSKYVLASIKLLLDNDWFADRFVYFWSVAALKYLNNTRSWRDRLGYVRFPDFVHRTFWCSNAASSIWKTVRWPSEIYTVPRFQPLVNQIGL